MRTCCTCKKDISHLHFNARYCDAECRRPAILETKRKHASHKYATHADEINAYRRGRRHLTRAVDNARCRNWRAENKEHVSEYNHEYGQKNPDVVRNKRRRRRARKKGAYQDGSAELFNKGPKCVFCESKNDLTEEHILPLDRGGSHTLDNLTTLCRSCNSSKGSKTWAEWLEMRGDIKVFNRQPESMAA